MNTLIIRAELAGPPSLPSSFRDLTMYTAIRHKSDILVEIEREFTDTYWSWMKPRGLLDFVDQFVVPGEEFGVFVDIKKRRPMTVYAPKIVPENLEELLLKLRGLLPGPDLLS